MNLLISYSHKDKKFANTLKKALIRYNLSVFLDEHEMQVGEDIAARLRNEIMRCDFVIIIITPNSIESNWVNWEIDFALNWELTENKVKVLPILMQGNLIPGRLKEKIYLDFRTDYLMKINFEKLIRYLLKSVPDFALFTPGDQKIDMARVNRDFFSEPALVAIKSPMIGTFYRKPSPDKPLFVDTGSIVIPGTVICIIEAMKLFNEIESQISGKITEILADDGQQVEYDQPLMLVDVSDKWRKTEGGTENT